MEIYQLKSGGMERLRRLIFRKKEHEERAAARAERKKDAPVDGV